MIENIHEEINNALVQCNNCFCFKLNDDKLWCYRLFSKRERHRGIYPIINDILNEWVYNPARMDTDIEARMIAEELDETSSVQAIAETIRDVFTIMFWEFKIEYCIRPAMEIWNELSLMISEGGLEVNRKQKVCRFNKIKKLSIYD